MVDDQATPRGLSRRRIVVLVLAVAALGLVGLAPLARRSTTKQPPAIAADLPSGYTLTTLGAIDTSSTASAVRDATGASGVRIARVFGPGDDLGSRVLDLTFSSPQNPLVVADKLSSIAPTSGVQPSTIDGSPAFVRPGSPDLLDASALRSVGNRVEVVYAGTEAQVRIILGGLIAAGR